NLCRLEGDEDPYQWSNKRKWLLSITFSIQNVAASMGASIFTPGITLIARDFGQSNVIVTLGLSFYVLGMAFGPIIFAPMSEVYGRKVVQAPAWILFIAFQFGCVFSQNIETLVICRFFVGVFASPALTVAGGVLMDIWEPDKSGPPMGLFTMAAFLGPVIGPIVGGFLVQGLALDEGWRWCFGVQLILSGVFLLNWLWIPETLQKTLILRKAQRQHKESGASGVVASKPDMAIFKKAVWRPLEMLFLDPIILLSSLYISFIFGILYLFFAAYPIVFQGRYHMKPGPSGLAFLGIGLGVLISFPTAGVASKVYIKMKAARGLDRFPEGRLPFSIIGSILVPVSLFWFAWSGFQRIHWIVPVLSGIPFGWSMTTIFINFISFIAEGYLEYAASAIAANTIMRSVFSAAFPLFSAQMYTKLKPEWASTLLGCISILFIPVPYLFWKYGPMLRERSRFNPGTGSA
ncbi:major facilitator superfamily domain-containing protein, partial [Tricharina praecox]|uniref:major facilitator superfamily domain-containing protein n=1 Tax=Tricharina praecox TaxID=43433 RepID=UPI00221FADA6